MVLTDGRVQSIAMPISPLPLPTDLQSILKDAELIKQYKLKTNNNSVSAPQESNGLWQCCCGEWNSGSVCSKCAEQKVTAFTALDLSLLAKEMNARLEEEKQRKAEADQRREKERQEREKQLAIEAAHRRATIQKTKKILAVVAPVLALVIVFAVWIYPNVIKPSMMYKEALELLASEQYDAATDAFVELEAYKNSAEMADEAQYQKAEKLLSQKQYEDAVAVYERIRDYKDSEEKRTNTVNIINSAKYDDALLLSENGQKAEAAFAFARLGNFADAKAKAKELWADIVSYSTIAVGFEHTVAIKENGEVVAAGSNDAGQCNVKGWTNVVSVSAGWENTVALCEDGTVVATDNDAVNKWTDIVSVSAGGYHIVGLKTDGTVVSVGSNSEGQCDVSGWTNIIAISAGQRHTVGLKADGTVVATGYNDNGQCSVSGWKDIVFISATMYRTVGVKADGTVVAAGDNDHGQSRLSDWTDIVSVASARAVTFGLKSDGTVVARGYNYKGVCEVEDWDNIVSIATNGDLVVGLTRTGSLIAEGSGRYGGWSGIRTSERGLNLPDEPTKEEVTDSDFRGSSISYYRELERSEDTYYKIYLSVYENDTIDLWYTLYKRNSSFEGGRITSFSKYRNKPISWNETNQCYVVTTSTGEIECTIKLSEGGAHIDFQDGEKWGTFEGQYEHTN